MNDHSLRQFTITFMTNFVCVSFTLRAIIKFNERRTLRSRYKLHEMNMRKWRLIYTDPYHCIILFEQVFRIALNVDCDSHL